MAQPFSATAPAPGQRTAVASLVCSLIFFVPLVTQALAVCLGVLALVQMGRSGNRRGLAWAGLMIGLLVGAGWALLLVNVWGWTSAPGGFGPTYAGTGYAWTPEVEGRVDRSQRIKHGLEQIGHALAAYGRDMDRWPAQLDELAPTYLAPGVLARIDPDRAPTANRLITLLPDVERLADPPDRIVAYSIEVEYDESGRRPDRPQRWVLLLNGQVEARDASGVDAALAERGHYPLDSSAAPAGPPDGQ